MANEGILTVDTRAYNQRRELVLSYRRNLLVYKRTAETPYAAAGYAPKPRRASEPAVARSAANPVTATATHNSEMMNGRMGSDYSSFAQRQR